MVGFVDDDLFSQTDWGESIKKIKKVIQDQLVKSRHIRSRVTFPDTTCMEKHIVYTTDSGLFEKGQRKLVKILRKLQDNGVAISGTIRNYARVGKKAFYKINKFGRGNLEEMRQPLEQLGEYAKKVMERVPEVLKEAKALLRKKFLKGARPIDRLCSELRTTVEQVQRVLRQTRARLLGIHVLDKLYFYFFICLGRRLPSVNAAMDGFSKWTRG